MTETEWLTETDPARHIRFVRDRLDARRSRLLAVAFCRTARDLLDDADLRAGLEVAERYADGTATRDELEACRSVARETAVKANQDYEQLLTTSVEAAAAHQLRNERAWAVALAAASPVPLLEAGWRVGTAGLRPLVWDVAGNPFRPVEFDPSWRTETVLALAGQMYHTREFSAMPILADALQDAGCDDDDVLTHCRGDSPHVRGCWVLDGVLGRN